VAVRLVILAVALLALASPASAAQVRDCGNYGYPEGHQGEQPIFTDEEIVGAGVYDIRSQVTRCRPTVRRMVRRFWNGRWGECEPGCRRGSYRCRDRQIGDEVGVMRCTASRGRVVRFEYGA
jgi:hypothetical protein